MLAIVLGIAGLTFASGMPHQQPDLARFCFAEWCVQPVAAALAAHETVVDVTVSSSAQAVQQRPDHPQAWLIDAHGRRLGGPQPDLERALPAQSSYSVRLRFAGETPGCSSLAVAEGAWPAFLGLGYAASPFTETATWRVCPQRAG